MNEKIIFCTILLILVLPVPCIALLNEWESTKYPEFGTLAPQLILQENDVRQNFLKNFFQSEMTKIRDLKSIAVLERSLSSPDISKASPAARLIMQEVMGNEHKELRLNALRRIAPLIVSGRKENCGPSWGQIDLHTHTYLSDAYSTPTAWVIDAFEQGLQGIAVTDHDVLPDDEAVQAAAIINEEVIRQGKLLDIYVIPGTEIAVRHQGTEIHLLVYLPRYFELLPGKSQDKRFTAIVEKLDKLHACERESINKLIDDVRQKYPSWEITLAEVEKIVRSHKLYRSAVSDLLWEKYREEFQRRGISSSKGVWYNFIVPEGLHKRPFAHENAMLTITDAVDLAILFGGKIGVAHPDEIMKQKEDAFTGVLEELARLAVEKDAEPNFIIGAAYYSHKVKRNGCQPAVKQIIDNLNERHPYFQSNKLRLLPESDAHGAFSLPDNPLGQLPDYPKDKTYGEDLLTLLEVSLFAETEYDTKGSGIGLSPYPRMNWRESIYLDCAI